MKRIARWIGRNVVRARYWVVSWSVWCRFFPHQTYWLVRHSMGADTIRFNGLPPRFKQYKVGYCRRCSVMVIEHI